jgi:uncharacterized protein YndB with AHSA1/START domain
MRRTRAIDCRTLPFDRIRVFAALVDFENYPTWWPAELHLCVLRTTPEFVGSRFEVHPHGGRFVCEVARIVHLREMVIHYVEGVHRGTGIWTLEPKDSGVVICYRIDLEPQGWLPRLLSDWLDFGRMHSQAMGRLFDGLEARLRRGGSAGG